MTCVLLSLEKYKTSIFESLFVTFIKNKRKIEDSHFGLFINKFIKTISFIERFQLVGMIK